MNTDELLVRMNQIDNERVTDVDKFRKNAALYYCEVVYALMAQIVKMQSKSLKKENDEPEVIERAAKQAKAVAKRPRRK